MQNILIPVLAVSLFACFLGLNIWLKRDRRRRFLAAAYDLGLTETPFYDRLPVMSNLPLFNHHGSFEVAAKGSLNGLDSCLFDYGYRVGKSGVTQTVASFMKPGYKRPAFQIRPHHFGDGLAQFFSGEVLDFADDPEFSERFTIHAPVPDQAREFLTPEVRAYFVQCVQGGETVECYWENVLIYKAGKVVNADQLASFLQTAGGIAAGLFALATKTQARAWSLSSSIEEK